MHGLRKATIAAATLAAVAVFAASASANAIPTTGAQITLGQCVASPCESTYPAGEPFFIRQGFITDGTEEDLRALLDPQTRFELTVDGQQTTAILDLEVNAEPPSKRYVTNFRFGMTGVHTFVGCWYSDGAVVFCGTRTVTFTE
jgi:hypothetical protein